VLKIVCEQHKHARQRTPTEFNHISLLFASFGYLLPAFLAIFEESPDVLRHPLARLQYLKHELGTLSANHFVQILVLVEPAWISFSHFSLTKNATQLQFASRAKVETSRVVAVMFGVAGDFVYGHT